MKKEKKETTALGVTKKIARSAMGQKIKIRRGIYNKCDVERQKIESKNVCHEKYK